MFRPRLPIFFILQHRLPVGSMRRGWRPWASTMTTNLAIATIAALLIWLIGIKPFLLMHLPILLLAASVGCLDVLRAASIRAHDLGKRPNMEPAPGASYGSSY